MAGATVAEELHLDESVSQKTFAPGYGEFSTGKGRDLERLTLAVPTDALAGPPPPQLESLQTSAAGMLGSVRAEDWEAAAATLRRMNADWDVLRRGTPPAMVASRLGASLRVLSRAVTAEWAARAAQAAIAAAHDAAGVSGDVATLEWIRDRFAHTLEPAGMAEVDTRIRALRTAADAARLAAAADHAARLGQRLRSL